MSSRKIILNIVVPTYNEKDNIVTLLKEVDKTASTIEDASIKILVVDDSSPDGTAEIARNAIRQLSSITGEILDNGKKLGLGAAYRRAFEYLLPSVPSSAEKDTYFLQMDADLSHDPKYLHDFVKYAKSEAKLIVASRYVKNGETPDWTLARKLLSKMGNLYTRSRFSSTIKDWTGGFNAYRADLLKNILPKLEENDYSIQLELKGLSVEYIQKKQTEQVHKESDHPKASSTPELVEFPISFSDRTSGESKLPTNALQTSLKAVGRISGKTKFNAKSKLPALFLAIAIPMCTFFALSTPFGMPNDEDHHYFRITSIAAGNLTELPEDSEKPNQHLGNFISCEHLQLFTHLEHIDTSNCNDEGSLSEQTVFTKFTNTAIYSPIAYLPQLIGFEFGELTNLPVDSQFVIMRFCSILLFLLSVFLAIRITPVGKWCFFAVALLPGTLAQMSAVSADPMVLSLSMLTIAVVLNLTLTRNKLKWQHIAALSVLFLAICTLKTPYFPLIFLLLLFISYYRNANLSLKRSQKITIISLAGVSTILMLIWYKVIGDTNLGVDWGTNPGEQMQFVLHHPLRFIGAAFNTLFMSYDTLMENRGFNIFGTFFSEKIYISPYMLALCAVILVLSIGHITQEEQRLLQGKRRYKILLVLVFIVCILATFGALYLQDTWIGGEYINGMQGRYLSPILPLVLIPLAGSISFKNPRIAARVTVGLIILVNIAACLTVLNAEQLLA